MNRLEIEDFQNLMDNEKPPITSSHPLRHEKIMGSMRKILIIDDEADIREVASLSLEATAAWQVMTASSGSQGIELAVANQPDAILMDVMMPEMDGPTTFHQMQQIPAIAHIPVLLLTAKVQGIDKRRFADLGVAAVLFKPFDPLTLAEQVAEALHWNTVSQPSESVSIPPSASK